MKFKIYLLVIVFAGTPASGGFWKTTGKEFVSPVTTDANIVFYSGSLLTIFLASGKIEDDFGHKIQDETVENKPLGGWSVVGDLAGQMIPNAIYVGTAYGLGKWFDDQGYDSKASHMLKSTVYAALFTSILKYTIREPRPNSNNREAFPSGHTTTAFVFASVVGTEHEWFWAVPAYGLATLTAFSRINDNAHQLHDVAAGAVIGTSYGLSIHYLNKDKNSLITKFNVLPLYDGLFANFRSTF